jgi:hypothetical protein
MPARLAVHLPCRYFDLLLRKKAMAQIKRARFARNSIGVRREVPNLPLYSTDFVTPHFNSCNKPCDLEK